MDTGKTKKMTVAYICSPYSGDVEANTENARKYSRFAADNGVIPVAPHLLFPQFIKEETERETALRFDMEILSRCDVIWAFGADEGLTDGMDRELDEADRIGMPVRFFTADMKEESYGT